MSVPDQYKVNYAVSFSENSLLKNNLASKMSNCVKNSKFSYKIILNLICGK